MLQSLLAEPLDRGSEHFPPSSLQLTTIDVGNAASNVIPGQATAALNVRFNDQHCSTSVERWLRERLDRVDVEYDLDLRVWGESFLGQPGPLSDLVSGAVE